MGPMRGNFRPPRPPLLPVCAKGFRVMTTDRSVEKRREKRPSFVPALFCDCGWALLHRTIPELPA
jgi:hypothetical protein